MIDDWQKSDETQALYCKRLGLNLNTFGYWRSRLCENKESKKKTFTKLVPTASTSIREEEKPIIIKLLSGVKIIIPYSISIQKLTDILEIIGVIHA